MRIGDSIREIREFEKSFKRNYVANKLSITTRAYANIENNISDISLSKLEKLAEIFDCSISYILGYKERKFNYINQINNNEGNKGCIHINQAEKSYINLEKMRLLENLLDCERKRISLLEALLRSHNIEF
jgi:transcriptional regulator with XRE-family HTH domain